MHGLPLDYVWPPRQVSKWLLKRKQRSYCNWEFARHLKELEPNVKLQLTALDLANRGEMVWSAATQPGPLLSSTISAMELDDRGQFMKLIPSLNGKLYKFNGEVSLVECEC